MRLQITALIAFLFLLHPLLKGQEWELFRSGLEGHFFRIDSTSFLASDEWEDIYKYNHLASWRVYENDGGLNTVEGITSSPNGTIYAVTDMWESSQGRVLKSIDKGNSWRSILVNSMAGPIEIYFINDSLGFVICEDSKIFRTSDAGENWKLVHFAGNRALRSIWFINDLEGFAVGGNWNGTISLRSQDSGNTWQSWSGCKGTSGRSVSFGSACTGYATSDTRVNRWDRQTDSNMLLPAPEGTGYSFIHFINDQVGYLAVDTNMVGQPNFHDEILLYNTIDGGTTWTLQDAPYPLSRPFQYQVHEDKLYLNCGIPLGYYKVIVMDLPSNTAFKVEEAITQPACATFPNGEIQLTIQGGVPPYEFDWLDLGITGDHPTQLGPGSYTVFVSDASGHCFSETYHLASATSIETAIQIRNEIFSNMNGSISLLPAGGYEPYNFEWSHSDTLHDAKATNLSTGTYEFTITDFYGCSIEDVATVKRVNLISSKPSFAIAFNPLNNNTIEVRTEEQTNILYRLFSSDGSLVKYGILDAQSDMIIDNSELMRGMYFLQLCSGQASPAVFPVLIWEN
jgi:hypothetical protein